MGIPKGEDKRIKLNEKERNEIKKKYKSGKTQKELAKNYGVSRKTIWFVLNPKKYEDHLENMQGRNWKAYYDKDDHNVYMKRYRKRKKQLQQKKSDKQ